MRTHRQSASAKAFALWMAVACLAGASAAAFVSRSPHPATELQIAPMNAVEEANHQFVLDWVRVTMENHHVELASHYMAEDYIQHFSVLDTGIEPYKKFFSDRPPTTPIPDKIRRMPVVSGAKGDYVWFVWESSVKDPADPDGVVPVNWPGIARMQGGKIQEHWDSPRRNAHSPPVAHPGISPRPPMQWNTGSVSKQERAALRIARRALPLLHGENIGAADTLVDFNYIEHDPNGAQGRAGFKSFWLEQSLKAGAAIRGSWKNAPVLTLADGPYVLMMWDRVEVDPADPAKTYVWNQFEIFRVQQNRIVEHWDNATPEAAPRP